MYLKDCQKASIQQEAWVECAEREQGGRWDGRESAGWSMYGLVGHYGNFGFCSKSDREPLEGFVQVCDMI